MAWFVYVLRCRDGSLYTGMTCDVHRRVVEHNSGRGGRYTRAHRPVTLIAAWRYGTRGAALAGEAWFKSLKRSQKLAWIRARTPLQSGTFAPEVIKGLSRQGS